MPGLAQPADRSSSALAAHRSRAACAVSRSPCTVTERTRVRPLTGSGPKATRTSHTPGRRRRSDPPPRTHPMPHGTDMPRRTAGASCSALTCVVGLVVGMRSCTEIIRNDRKSCGATDLGSAPGGIRTPNLLIQAVILPFRRRHAGAVERLIDGSASRRSSG